MASSDAELELDEGGGLLARVNRVLGLAIVRGEYAPGARLPFEAALATELAVGRNILRESIKMLAAKGLVRTVRRAGTTVQPKSSWNLLDADVLGWTLETPALREPLLAELTTLRGIVEPQVAALAAEQATSTEILRLYEAYDEMERFVNDPVLAIEADIAFHERLFEASHNLIFQSLLRAIATLLRANFEITIRAEGAFIRNLEEHRVVAEAVRRRDADTAREAMRKLLANNEDDLDAMLGRGRGRKGRGGANRAA